MMGIADLLVIIAYFVIVAAIGLYMKRRIKMNVDYALAGRNLNMPLTLGTLVATQIGADTIMGRGGMTWQYGAAIQWGGIAFFIGYVLYSRFAVKLRRSNVWTAPEVLERRYGLTTKRISSIILVLAIIGVYGAQLIASGIIFQIAGDPFGISYRNSILIAGIILVAYTLLGGLWGVAYTDWIQFLILYPVFGFILPLIIFNKVSFSDMRIALDPMMFNFWQGVPFQLILGMLATYIPLVICDPTIWQRTMSAKNEKIAKWSPLYAGLLYLYISIMVTLMGLAGRILLPNIVSEYGTADYTIPVMMAKYLPGVVIGLGLAGILAVCMSTASGCLLMGAVITSKDLIPSWTGRKLTQAQELKLSRVTTIVIGILGIIFALTFKGIFWILLVAYGIFLGGMFFPVLLGLFWKKATPMAAYISIPVSSLVLLVYYAIGKPFGIQPIVPALLVSLILMVVISWITYKEDKATLPILAQTQSEQLQGQENTRGDS
jgi:SSS family solute:Na+ symporter